MAKSTKALEAIAALKQLRSAPSVVIPGKMTELEKAVLESKGKYGAQRVQRAADEIKNLEQQYTLDALRGAFLGDNAKALMIGKPGEFQRFAAKVDEPYRPAVEQYLREMSRQGGGTEDVPFLDINRRGPEWLPQITGHEGRHRNIAMDELGHESTLWRLLPTNDMRESMPRRSQEQFIEALRQELGLNRFVTPEGRSLLPTDLSAPEHQNLERRGLTAGNRPVLPEPFAGGGMAKGGSKVTKAVKEFIDPPSTKLQDWNWRPLEAVSKDLNLTEIPDYIQKGYGSFMADQAARAAAGDLKSRDLLKAYLITQSSIGRQGRSYNTATKAGLKVPRTDELVRPEGAFAAWLGSKSGQRYLDAAMKGELDKKAVAEIQSQFAPFGKQNVLGNAMVGAVDMVPKMAPTLNQSIMGLPDDYRDYAEQLKGIAAAKSGFVGSLLGRGDLPTFDARQIYLHTAGQPLPTKIPESILDRGKGLGGREAVDRLAARQDALGLKLDPALDPYYQHLAHHAVWDKSGGSQTTHQDLIDAMTNYKDGGKVKRRDIDEFKLLGEDEAARARPFDTGYRKPEPKQTPMEKLDATLKQQGSFAAPRPRATTVSQYEKDFRNSRAREQAEREQAVKSGLTSWATDIPGTVADLAVDLPYYLGQRVMGRRGDNIRPLGYGERVRAELATALGLQNPPSDEVGMRPPPAHEEVTDAISLLNPLAWTVAGDPVGIARAGTKAVKSVGKAVGKEAGRRIDDAMMTGEGMLGSALSPARPSFIKAYHGTPHRFPPTEKNPLGEFDPTKIGTGEGAQAYGYGHYLAENPSIANSYANQLGKFIDRIQTPNGVMSLEDALTKHHPGGGSTAKLMGKLRNKLDVDSYNSYIQDELVPEMRVAMNLPKEQWGEVVGKAGTIYKVDLPDEHIARMLDWDKPLSEQTESVQKVLRDLADRDAKIYGESGGLDYYMGDPESYSGESVYRYLTEQLSGKPETSNFFKNANIPGIKYFDASSRDAGEGTRNFVVFPGGEDLLTIEERMKKGGSVSQDSMQIKAWDKAIGGPVKHMATGDWVKGGKALFSGIDRLVNPPKDIAKTLGAEARSARQQAIEAEGRRAEAAKNLEPTVGYRPTAPLNPDPLVGTRYKVGPTKNIITAPAFDPDKHIGANTLVLDWDSTSRNTPIKEVSGNKVNIPTHGGYQWTLDQGNIARGSGGASGPTIVPRIVTRMNNSAREGIEQGGTGEALSIMQTMGEGAENFALPKSQFLFKLVNQRLKEGAITEDDANKLLGLIQTRNPGLYGDLSNFAGFSPKGWRQIHKNAKESGLLVPESESTTSGKLRTGIGHVADMAATQKMLGYNIEDLTNALTAEKLRGVPKGHMGAVVMRNPEGGVEMMESPLYPYKSPYSHEWTANPVGEFPEMIDTQALMYRTMSPIAKDLLARQNRIAYKPTTLRNAVLGSLTKNNENVSQIIDPQFSDDYYTYMRELGKKNEQKDGGAVHMAEGGQSRQPVDRSLPDLGAEERLRMEDYLRRMRFTGGGSGDKYGTGVGGRAMMNFPVGPAVVQPYVGGGVYKPQGGKLTGGVSEAGVNLVVPFADGGEVSADDLIVEERPL